MANITKETIARNASCDAITGQLDQSGYYYSTGHLSIYDMDATRLTWHVLSNPAFGSAVDGTSMAYPISDATVLQDGTASTFAFENQDGSTVWNGLVSLYGQGGALQLESLSLYQDATVGIASALYIVPA
jgi:hypothetical protein